MQSKSLTHCDQLTLIVMEGETKTITVGDKTIQQVLAPIGCLEKSNINFPNQSKKRQKSDVTLKKIDF